MADMGSRQETISTEWALDQQTFQWLELRAGPFQLDLFATHYNSQLPDFVSPFPDPQAIAGMPPRVNDWKGGRGEGDRRRREGGREGGGDGD